MAGNSCVFKPTVRNKKGEEVESKLFNDLLHFSSNDREFAKKWYYVGTHESFLSKNANRISYDENGEITFKSLKSLVTLDLSEEKILDKLNKDIGAGEYEYGEAESLMTSFNSTSPYNNEYIATISPVENGKTRLKVVKKTKASQASLEENVANKCLFDRIKQAINRLGGDIEFIDEDYSKYDTINAQKAASGLYSVIFLSRNGNLTSDMAEEAGHFAVGALGKSPLVIRLESLCTPEVQKRILGDHYRDVETRKNPRRETAGFLVGQYIRNEIDEESPLKRIVGRVVNAAKRMFSKITSDEVGRMQLEARSIAREIAKGFISGENAGSIEQALETKEVLYSSEDSIQVSSFKNILKQLNLMAAEMQAIDRNMYKKWKEIEVDSEIGRLFQNPSFFADLQAVDGIANAVQQLAESAPEMIDLLNSIDYDSSNVPASAKALREVKNYVRHSLAILGIIDNMLASSSFKTEEGLEKSLKEAHKSLSSLINGDNRLTVNLLKAQRKLFLVFLKDVYGSDYVDRASRVLFNRKKFRLERIEAESMSIERAMTMLDEDDNFMNRYIASMANSSDIINQLAYKARAAAQQVADDQTLQAWDQIRALEAKTRKLKVNTNNLLEVGRDGKLTGNYISDHNWGDWENDWIEFKNKQKEEFNNDPKYQGMTPNQKEYLWDVYFKPLAQEWHNAHSIYDKETGKATPNDKYLNDKYNSLTDDEREILKGILEIKQNADDLLTYTSYNGEVVEAAHTTLYRMPQFRGSTQNRIENLKRNMSLGKAVRGALRQNIINTFTINSEDRDYGSAETHNTLEEDIFEDKLDFEKQKIKRVPLYGINKFKDMSELSTDVFNGLLQYAAMATTYNATSSIVDALEMGKDILSERQVEGLQTENQRDKKSWAYSRYLDFLDAQVYNLYSKQVRFGKLVVAKIFNFLGNLASKVFLGGNIPGGIVNVLTGFNEITKEAIAGETYTLADLKKANALYRKFLPANWLEAGMAVKNNKLSLFMRKYNVQNNLDTDVRRWSTREGRLFRLNPFGNNLMLPYKSGDHYMQTISYLAAANHYKFVDKNNNKISLWDALKVKDIDPDNPKAGKTLELRDDVLFLDPKNNNQPREWTFDDDLNFKNMCRETNNRMHGIYNGMDKTAFHNMLIGQAILAMRGYALGLLYRRFSTNHYSVVLGRESEGSIVTLAKVVANMCGATGGSYKNILPSLRAIICPFGKGVENSMLKMGFSVEQYRNMRRNFADFALIAILGMLKVLTAKPDDDDDDEDKDKSELNTELYSELSGFMKKKKRKEDTGNRFTGLCYYLISRLYMEQSAYNTPWGIWTEQKSVLDWMPSGFSVVAQILDIGKLFLTQEEYKNESELHEEGDKKWEYKVKSYIPYYRSIKVFDHPYESAKAYEYGRATYK